MKYDLGTPIFSVGDISGYCYFMTYIQSSIFAFFLVPFNPIHSLPLWHMGGVVGKVDNGGDRV